VKLGSLKLRLAFLVGALGLVQAAAILFFSYLAFERALQSQRLALLHDKAHQARLLIDEMRDGAVVKANAYKLVDLVTGRAELHLAVVGTHSGETYLAFSPEAVESLRRLRSDTWQPDGLLGWRAPAGRQSMLSLATAGKTTNGQPYEIVLTVDRSQDMRLLNRLLLTAGAAAPFALAVVFFSALVIVALGLKPVERFKATVEGISARSLTQRIDTTGLPEELQRLGSAFNLMLDRLDDAVTRLSQFSDDLAHEMRTPLATLLGRTQVALSQERTAEQLVDVMEHNVEEFHRLSHLVSDMLFLAQVDHAENALNLAPLDLRREALRIAEFLELVAQERGVSIAVNGWAEVVADGGLTQRAITNLLSNAVTHSTAGSEIQVNLARETGGTRLDVVNEGVPIDRAHLERLFERFYRMDPSRGRDLGGTGLGLAIVRAIMKLHGGRASADSTRAGQVRFSLFFPDQAAFTAPGPTR
jgi:two-component system heavy metal sensor histidine kinase CusS